MDNKNRQSISEWLGSREGGELIRKLAARLSRNPIMQRLMYVFDLDPTTEPVETIEQTIASELVMFLNKPRIAALLASGAYKNSLLDIAFINHCRDLVRKHDRQKDAYREFDRHVDDVLRNSEKFFRLKSKKNQGIRFSTKKDAILIPALPDEYMRQIPFPLERFPELSYEKINRKSVLIELAAYFVQTAAAFYDRSAVYVFRHDFVRWLAGHVRVAGFREISFNEGHKTSSGEHDGGRTAEWQYNDTNFAPDRLHYHNKMLPRWAENFVQQMTPKQQMAFLFHLCEGMTLEETAEKMGLKQASGASYHLDAAKNRLRFFLRDLPGLCPDADEAFDDEAFLIFRDHLCLFLKNYLSGAVD